MIMIITQFKPFVSVCTPTYNRREYIKRLIKIFDAQDYPKDRLEWIVVDDGTDKVADLFRDHPQVKYFDFCSKMPIGKKRNIMHQLTTGDIIVYMDDDDYYPPCRITHAVERLQENPKALCAGSSKLYVYFSNLDNIYLFGPYNETHATANTFAFHRNLLDVTSYDDDAFVSEEKYFLKNYTIPFVQLDPFKTILTISHNTNTFDKKNIIQYAKKSNKKIHTFISEPKIRSLFVS